MMEILRFTPEHVERLRASPSQPHVATMLHNTAYLQSLCASDSWTAAEGGRVLACGGLVHLWPGHAQAWALIAGDVGGGGMIKITRVAERMLSLHAGRIEAIVAADFKRAHDWAVLLGFTRETPGVMQKWFPDGAAAVLYARVN